MSKARDLANAGTALGAVTATELGYVDGVTSAIQTQIDTKLATATAATTYQAINANVSTTELGYLDGVTSAIQTQLDAKIAKTLTTTTGDIIYASSANTPARLGIGSTDQILKVSSGVPTWATPAASGGIWTQIATGSLSGSSVSVTGLTGKSLYIAFSGMSGDASMANSRLQFNGDTAGNYSQGEASVNTTTSSNSNTYFSLVNSMTASQVYSGGIFVYFSDSSLALKPVSGLDLSGYIHGYYRSTSAITSCRFHGNGGSFDAGTYIIYSMS